MEWVANDWIWILIIIGVAWFVARRGGMGCGMSHRTPGPGSQAEDGKGRETRETVEAAKGEETGHRHRGWC